MQASKAYAGRPPDYAGQTRIQQASKVYAGFKYMPAIRYLQAGPAFKSQAWPAYASGGL